MKHIQFAGNQKSLKNHNDFKGYWDNLHLILPAPFFCAYLQLEINRVMTKRLPFQNLGRTTCDVWLKESKNHICRANHTYTHIFYFTHNSITFISLSHTRDIYENVLWSLMSIFSWICTFSAPLITKSDFWNTVSLHQCVPC